MKPLGGLARKATVIEDIKNDGLPLFIVDAGDLFFKKVNYSPGNTFEAAKIQAGMVRDAFNIIGCDGINIGAKDLGAGLDFLKSLKSEASFPFLSANIKYPKGGLVFEPYRIIPKAGVTVGLIGLTSVLYSPDVEIEDPVMAFERIANEVDAESDMVVLLIESFAKLHIGLF